MFTYVNTHLPKMPILIGQEIVVFTLNTGRRYVERKNTTKTRNFFDHGTVQYLFRVKNIKPPEKRDICQIYKLEEFSPLLITKDQ